MCRPSPVRRGTIRGATPPEESRESRAFARWAQRHGDRSPWWLIGLLAVALLVGHDAAAALTSHGSGSDSAAITIRVDPGASAPVDHTLHAPSAHDDGTDAPPPADQPCLADQSGMVPFGTDAPELPEILTADAAGMARLEPPCGVSADVPTLSPAVRRALLQVYLN